MVTYEIRPSAQTSGCQPVHHKKAYTGCKKIGYCFWMVRLKGNILNKAFVSAFEGRSVEASSK
eukprot:1149032-Pelagomonas_calceolata.AAC.1